MRVLHIVASIESESAGPSVSVPRLAEAQAARGADVTLATIGDPEAPHHSRTIVHHRLYPQTAAGVPVLSSLLLSRSLQKMLAVEPRSFDVVHSHGLWLAPNVYPAAAARQGALWVVAPRGMLGEAALRFSALKKKAFWALVQGPALRHAGLIHATSEEEARATKKAGVKAPAVVVPNGVDLPPDETVPGYTSRRTILSLGRVHPKKGLDRLIDAWSLIAPRFPDWDVRIVGPDEGGHADLLKARIDAAKLPRITVEGPLFGARKTAAYREAGVFAMPTLNENFAMTVAEALAAGTPVISTKGAPWRGLETHNCGRWIEHGPKAMADSLAEILSLDDQARALMGQRGRAWMAAEFSWDHIADRLLKSYCAYLPRS